VPFTISVINPCELIGSNILQNTISDIEYWIDDGSVAEVLGAGYWDDQWSQSSDFNQANYCGIKLLELFDSDQFTPTSASYLSLSNVTPSSTATPLTLTIDTDDPQYATNSNVVYYIKVSLVDYPDGEVYYEPFNLNIRVCMIQSITSDSDLSHTYNIYTPVEYITYSEFTQVHVAGTQKPLDSDCGYTLDYTAQWRTYYNTLLSLPSFISWDHLNLRFEV
jgi:hypothetical protein